MKSIGKTNHARRNEIVAQLRTAEYKLTETCENYNNVVAAAWRLVADAQDEYNAIVIDANGFREDVVSDIQSYVDHRSDNWRDGERGSAYEEWKGQWETELEEVSLDEPDELATNLDESAADILSDFEEEPNQ